MFTAQDYKKGQPRWCPGCGDHFFLASLHKAMAEIGVEPWNTAVISGIGCSSRLPHYMATYGKHTIEVLKAANAHKGASVTEVLQNCVIFNDGTHASVYNSAGRAENAIYVEHGKPLIFGKDREFGLVQEGFGLKVVKIGENGITEKDILVHDAHCEDNTLQLKLALMGNGDGFPVALGVIRDVDAPTYDDCVTAQIEEVKAAKKYHNFAELLETNDIWEVK